MRSSIHSVCRRAMVGTNGSSWRFVSCQCNEIPCDPGRYPIGLDIITAPYVPGRIKSTPQSANQHTSGGTKIIKPNILARNAVPTGTAKPSGSRINWKMEKNTWSKKRLTFEKRVSFRRDGMLRWWIVAAGNVSSFLHSCQSLPPRCQHLDCCFSFSSLSSLHAQGFCFALCMPKAFASHPSMPSGVLLLLDRRTDRLQQNAKPSKPAHLVPTLKIRPRYHQNHGEALQCWQP